MEMEIVLGGKKWLVLTHCDPQCHPQWPVLANNGSQLLLLYTYTHTHTPKAHICPIYMILVQCSQSAMKSLSSLEFLYNLMDDCMSRRWWTFAG